MDQFLKILQPAIVSFGVAYFLSRIQKESFGIPAASRDEEGNEYLVLRYPRAIRLIGLWGFSLFVTGAGLSRFHSSNSSLFFVLFCSIFAAALLYLFIDGSKVFEIRKNEIRAIPLIGKAKTYRWSEITNYEYGYISRYHQLYFKNGLKLSVSEMLVGINVFLDRFATEHTSVLLNALSKNNSKIQEQVILSMIGMSGHSVHQEMLLKKYLSGDKIQKGNALNALLINISKSKTCAPNILGALPGEIRSEIESYLKSS